MNHTYEAPTSSEASEPKLESEQEVKLVSLGAKLGIFHVGHALLVGAHAVAVVAAVKGWFITVAATNVSQYPAPVSNAQCVSRPPLSKPESQPGCKERF
jgi:hypothetical protein